MKSTKAFVNAYKSARSLNSDSNCDTHYNNGISSRSGGGVGGSCKTSVKRKPDKEPVCISEKHGNMFMRLPLPWLILSCRYWSRAIGDEALSVRVFVCESVYVSMCAFLFIRSLSLSLVYDVLCSLLFAAFFSGDEAAEWLREHYSDPGFLHPAEYLADLECLSPQFAHWRPFIDRIQSLTDVELQFPSEEFEDYARHFFTTVSRENESEKTQQIMFWAELRSGKKEWLLDRSCIMGATTVYYIIAWLAAREDDWPVAKFCIRAASKMLLSNSLDLLDESFWPWKSRDIHFLRWRIENRDAFQDHLVFPLQTIKPDIPLVQLPLVWPTGVRAPRESCGSRKKVVVWWISKHHAPMSDFHHALDLYAPQSWQVEVRSNMISEYCHYDAANGYCSSDEKLLQIMRADHVLSRISQKDCGDDKPQWCGMLELHADFEAVSVEFARHYRHLEQEVNLFVCGHPLFWCELFSSFSTPVLGILDLQHLGFVPEELQEDWTRRFLEIFFGERRNLLVAGGLYQAFASNWLLGIRIPYVTKASLSLSRLASLEATYESSVLINMANVQYHDRLVQSYVSALPYYPLSLLRWPHDLA